MADSLVQHQGTGGRLGGAGHQKQNVQVCHRRPHEYVLARGDLCNDRSTVLGFQRYLIPGHRGDLLLAKNAAGLAFHDAIRRFNVVKTADAFYDITVHACLRQPNSEAHQSARPEPSLLEADSPVSVLEEEPEEELLSPPHRLPHQSLPLSLGASGSTGAAPGLRSR